MGILSRRNRILSRGLSFFELLVVLVVIFVLVILLLFSFSHLIISTKITRVKEEHNVLARGLANYHMDYSSFPPTAIGLAALTAPTAYLGSIPIDPFALPGGRGHYFYLREPNSEIAFIIISMGPDGDNDLLQLYNIFSNSSPSQGDIIKYYLETKLYDPTNGIKSDGDVIFLRKK